MAADDDIMTSEEFFGGIAEPKKAPRRTCARGKKPEKLFTAVKVKMIMRVHGVSRVRALEIVALREIEKKAEEEAKAVLKLFA